LIHQVHKASEVGADVEGPERKNGASEKPLSKAINNSRSDGIELKVKMKWLRNNRSG